MAPKELLKTSNGSGMPYQLWNRVSSKNVTFSCQIRPLTSRTLKLCFWNSLQTIWYCIYIWLWLLQLHRPDTPYDPLIEYVCSPKKELSFKKPSLGSLGLSTFSTHLKHRHTSLSCASLCCTTQVLRLLQMARSSTSKKDYIWFYCETHITELLALLWWSATKPTWSRRNAST